MKKVVIIGGGIVGCTCGFYLSLQPDIQVELYDYDLGQATKNAAGIICPWFSLRRNKKWLNLVNQGAYFYEQFMQDLLNNGIYNLPYQKTGTYIFKKTQANINKILKQLAKNQTLGINAGNYRIFDPEATRKLFKNLKNDYYTIYAENGGILNGELLIQQLKTLIQKNKGIIYNKQAYYHNNHVYCDNKIITYDELIIATGAWIQQTLPEYNIDVYPQKGQLVKLKTDNLNDTAVLMLDGELDIIPTMNNELAIGATHENHQNFNLDIDYDLINQMIIEANNYLKVSDLPISSYHVGTRAYTSDFTPFFGKLDHFYVVSGLGSSGLTSGPIIAYNIVEAILNKKNDAFFTSFSPENYCRK